eukprot:c29419_g1_i1 orf=93-290(+)
MSAQFSTLSNPVDLVHREANSRLQILIRKTLYWKKIKFRKHLFSRLEHSLLLLSLYREREIIINS